MEGQLYSHIKDGEDTIVSPRCYAYTTSSSLNNKACANQLYVHLFLFLKKTKQTKQNKEMCGLFTLKILVTVTTGLHEQLAIFAANREGILVE